MRALALSHAAAKALDGSRPQHAEGAELGNLKKIICANGKGECDRGCGAIDRHVARLHLRQKIDAGRKREADFFNGGGAGLFKLRTIE